MCKCRGWVGVARIQATRSLSARRLEGTIADHYVIEVNIFILGMIMMPSSSNSIVQAMLYL